MSVETVQRYFCELCKYDGSVTVRPGEDVWSVVQKLADDHAGNSPLCKQPADRLRVVNE